MVNASGLKFLQDSVEGTFIRIYPVACIRNTEEPVSKELGEVYYRGGVTDVSVANSLATEVVHLLSLTSLRWHSFAFIERLFHEESDLADSEKLKVIPFLAAEGENPLPVWCSLIKEAANVY